MCGPYRIDSEVVCECCCTGEYTVPECIILCWQWEKKLASAVGEERRRVGNSTTSEVQEIGVLAKGQGTHG